MNFREAATLVTLIDCFWLRLRLRSFWLEACMLRRSQGGEGMGSKCDMEAAQKCIDDYVAQSSNITKNNIAYSECIGACPSINFQACSTSCVNEKQKKMCNENLKCLKKSGCTPDKLKIPACQGL